MAKLYCFITGLLLLSVTGLAQKPNIILLIADDLGVDVSNGYHQNTVMASTPHLDELRANGITFENVWATPMCTPTRATIMSGKYGVKTGVLKAPGHLSTEHPSLFTSLAKYTQNAYAGAVVGKWHISQPSDPQHPLDHGIDHYMGILGAQWNAYDDWERTEDGVTTVSSEYASSAFTNDALEWIGEQEKPWFLWLAHVAPHTPIHLPPDSMYTLRGTNTNYRKYLAMIESFDYEVGRLLDSLPPAVLANTIIFYIGDNGTPGNFLQNFPNDHAKGTLYQGGIHVPMSASGYGVTRKGEREDALIHVNDLHATILEIAGAELPGGLHNSLSFKPLLSGKAFTERSYNYSEIADSDIDAYTIRNKQYKLIHYTDGTQEFFDLQNDSLEFTNLMTNGLNAEQQALLREFEAEAKQLQNAWSCNDHIKNGDEDGIDCGGTYCEPCDLTGVDEHHFGMSIYPNPAKQQLNVRRETVNDKTMLVRVLTMQGQTLVTKEWSAGWSTFSLDLSSIAPQMLLLEVSRPAGEVNLSQKEYFKIMKE